MDDIYDWHEQVFDQKNVISPLSSTQEYAEEL